MNGFLIFLWAAMPARPSLETPITYETRAVRAEVAMAALSKLAGTSLTVSPAVKDEFVILRFDYAPLKDAMEKIATACAAEWQAETDGWRLIRSQKLLRLQDERHIEQRVQRIAAAQSKLKQKLAQDGSFDELKAKTLVAQFDAIEKDSRESRESNPNWSVQERLQSSTPAGRLGLSIASSLDPQSLATMGIPGRLVFSTAPNRMQRALPRSALDAIRRFDAEQTRFRTHLGPFDLESRNLPYSLYALRSSLSLKDQAPAKVLAIASCHDLDGNLSVAITVANAAGQVLDQTHASLSLNNFPNGPPPAPAPDPTGDPPLASSPATKVMSDMLTSVIARGGDPESMPPLPDLLRPTFLEPEEHSITELSLSDFVLGTARARKVNVAARATDLLGFFTIMLFGGGSPSASQFLQRLKEPQFDTVVEESPGWIVLRSVDPVVDRLRKFDRSALGKIVRAADKGQTSIEDFARFAASTPDGFDRIGVLLPLMVVAPSIGRTFERCPWVLLRFHGTLTPNQLSSLDQTADLRFAQLLPLQKQIYHQIVFLDQNNLARTTRSEVGVSAAPEEEFRGPTIRWEPTELLPNGIPAEATVTIRRHLGAIIQVRGTLGQYPTSTEMDTAQLAWYLYSKENPSPQPNVVTPNYIQFTSGSQRKFEYRFSPNASFGFSGELKELLGRTTTVDSPEKLPAEVWAKIQAGLASYRKQVRPPSGGGSSK